MSLPEKKIDSREIENLKKHLDARPKILGIAHANPDGDTIGATIGMCESLVKVGQNVQMACADPIPEKYFFLNGAQNFLTDFDPADFDSVIFFDCGDKKMAKFQEQKPEILTQKFKINIDHHPTNDHFGDLNFVQTTACSSTQIVFQMLQNLDIPVSAPVATALLTGIYTDTGAFRHQNTTPETFQTASALIQLGAETQPIARNLFQKYEIKTLKLWSKVLQNLHLTPEKAAIVGISREDYLRLGATREDLEGVVDYINSMPEADYCVLLSEDEKGNVKASLRTRKNDIDVKALAEKFGGGGHVKAAGFTVHGSHLQQEVKWKIVSD